MAGGAADSSTTSSVYDDVSAAAASVSPTTTLTVDSYLPSSSTTLVTQYYNDTTTSSTSTIWYTPPTSTSTTIWYTPDASSPTSWQQATWTSTWDGQHSSHDHGPPPSTTTVLALPSSTDASAYLRHVFPPSAAQPTWATGAFYTQLASALYAVDRSFAGRADYATIVAAISRAGDADSPQVSASLAASAWGWAAVTTNGWYQSDVPAPVQTDVARYVGAWHDAEFSVLSDAQRAEATETGRSGGGGGHSGSGGKGGGDGSSSPASSGSPATSGKIGARVMVGVVAGLLVGVIGLL